MPTASCPLPMMSSPARTAAPSCAAPMTGTAPASIAAVDPPASLINERRSSDPAITSCLRTIATDRNPPPDDALLTTDGPGLSCVMCSIIACPPHPLALMPGAPCPSRSWCTGRPPFQHERSEPGAELVRMRQPHGVASALDHLESSVGKQVDQLEDRPDRSDILASAQGEHRDLEVRETPQQRWLLDVLAC